MLDVKFNVRNYDKQKTFITIKIKDFIKTYQLLIQASYYYHTITFRVPQTVYKIDYTIFSEPYRYTDAHLTEKHCLRKEIKGTRYLQEDPYYYKSLGHKHSFIDHLYDRFFNPDVIVLDVK